MTHGWDLENSSSPRVQTCTIGQGWAIIFCPGPRQKFLKWPQATPEGTGPQAEGVGQECFELSHPQTMIGLGEPIYLPLPTKHPCPWQWEETSSAPPPPGQSGSGGGEARETSFQEHATL